MVHTTRSNLPCWLFVPGPRLPGAPALSMGAHGRRRSRAGHRHRRGSSSGRAGGDRPGHCVTFRSDTETFVLGMFGRLPLSEALAQHRLMAGGKWHWWMPLRSGFEARNSRERAGMASAARCCGSDAMVSAYAFRRDAAGSRPGGCPQQPVLFLMTRIRTGRPRCTTVTSDVPRHVMQRPYAPMEERLDVRTPDFTP
jgi:hypothetical protein